MWFSSGPRHQDVPKSTDIDFVGLSIKEAIYEGTHLFISEVRIRRFQYPVWSTSYLRHLLKCHRGGRGGHGRPTFRPVQKKKKGNIFKPRYVYTLDSCKFDHRYYTYHCNRIGNCCLLHQLARTLCVSFDSSSETLEDEITRRYAVRVHKRGVGIIWKLSAKSTQGDGSGQIVSRATRNEKSYVW